MRSYVLNVYRPSCLAVLKPSLNGLADIDLIHEVIPGGILRQVLYEAPCLIFDWSSPTSALLATELVISTG